MQRSSSTLLRSSVGLSRQQALSYASSSSVAVRHILHKNALATKARRNQQRWASNLSSPSSISNQDNGPISIPGNIPREDYATPTMYTFGILGRKTCPTLRIPGTKAKGYPFTGLFRYSIYASLAIVLGGSALYVSVHAYIEYIVLHGRTPIALSDETADYFELPELVPGFSGAHLGGGTDPSIGWRARNAARGAWIALNLLRGGVVPGNHRGHTDVAVPDKAWLEAEGLLNFALERIEEKQVKEGDQAVHIEAKWELMTRLAEVQSRLAGTRGLSDAKRTYQQLIMEVQESSSAKGEQNKDSIARLVELQRRLAETELRIVNEVLAKRLSKEMKAEQVEKALARMRAASEQALRAAGASISIPDAHLAVEPEQPVQATSSSWFSRGNKTSSITSAVKATVKPNNTIPYALGSLSSHPVDPIVLRSLVSSLLTLTTSLATSGSLNEAVSIAQASLGYLDKSIAAPTSASTDESRLQNSWLLTRKALLQSYVAELNHALQPVAATSSETSSPTLLLDNSVAISRSALATLPTLPKSSTFSPSHYLDQPLQEISKAAYNAGALAAHTRGLLAEVVQKDDKVALEKYEEALSFVTSSGSGGSSGPGSDSSSMKAKVLESIRRCRERLTTQ